MRRILTVFLLLCATAHCVLSIFYVNTSYLDLTRYAAGLSPLPFQHRLLLIPFVRWAAGCHLLQTLALRWSRFVPQAEPMTAAKLGCLLLGVVSVAALGAATLAAARRLGLRPRWLPWALLLVILYASYAARSEQALWYPYDLPHLALFGLATLFLLLDEPLAFAACISLDCFVRETALFLILTAVLLHWRTQPKTTHRRLHWPLAITFSLVAWAASRLLADWLYPNLPTRLNAVPWYRMAAPWHWPQLLSIVGFLWIPVCLGYRWLQPRERLALAAASALMLATFFFATWNETRAWLEWSTLFAVLAALQLQRSLRADHTLPTHPATLP